MAYTALYRQYRPHNFDDVIGQEALIKTLKGQITSSHINHAYLFCGPRGVGKTTIARILAKAINCKNSKDGNFCGECSACAALDNQSNFDVVEIDAASNNRVDNIRDLRENIKFMPVAGKFRVYIIDEVHMLSNSAFNALLKTLEEPPEHIVFIMATTEPNKLPITVLSRCQRFDFNRVSTDKIARLLEDIAKSMGISIDKDAVVSIARASEGGVRDAISLLDQCSTFTDGTIAMSDVSSMLGSANKMLYFALSDAIIKQDLSRALNGFAKMLDDGCNVLTVASDLMSHFRDLFIARHVKDIALSLSVDDTTASRLNSQGKVATDGVLLRCMEIFSTLESDLRYASHPRIWVELSIGKACRCENENSYDDLLLRVEKLENDIANNNFVKQVEIPAQENKKVNIPQSFREDAPPAMDEEYFPYSDEGIQSFEPEYNNEVSNKKENKSAPDLMDAKKPATKKETKQESAPLKQEKKKTADNKTNNTNHASAQKLWDETILELRKNKKMGLATAMKKGKADVISDDILYVLFPPDAKAAIERMKENDNKMLIKQTLKNIYGSNLDMKVTSHTLSEESIAFQEKVEAMFPKDILNTKYSE